MYAGETVLEKIEGNPLPAEFRVRLKDRNDNIIVAERLETRPEISVDPDTMEKEILFPEEALIREVDRENRKAWAIRLSVLGVYVVLAVLVFMTAYYLPRMLEASKARSAARYKECPFCCSKIPAQAVKCRYCGSDLMGSQ